MSSGAEQVLDDPLLPTVMSRARGEGHGQGEEDGSKQMACVLCGSGEGADPRGVSISLEKEEELVEAVMVEQDLAEMVTV